MWAANGVNRPELCGRTAPSAMNAQKIDLYLAIAERLYFYVPREKLFKLVLAKDVRRVTGYQDFFDSTLLDLVYVSDHTRMSLISASKRSIYSSVSAGSMAQNVALYCAAPGLASVVREWFDGSVLAQAMGLGSDRQVLISQTVGHPGSVGN
jgi:hypothetical protein